MLARANDTDPPASPLWSEDMISGMNEASIPLSEEWVAGPFTPTFVSSTSFTVPGDQTQTLTPNGASRSWMLAEPSAASS